MPQTGSTAVIPGPPSAGVIGRLSLPGLADVPVSAVLLDEVAVLHARSAEQVERRSHREVQPPLPELGDQLDVTHGRDAPGVGGRKRTGLGQQPHQLPVDAPLLSLDLGPVHEELRAEGGEALEAGSR